MKQLDREGRFRVTPAFAMLREAQSGAVGIQIDFKIVADWTGEEWRSWEGYDEYEVEGTFWVIKKDGGVNQSAVDQLTQVLGWSGSLDDLTFNTATVVQVAVKAETYNEFTSYRASWLYPADADPLGGQVNDQRTSELQTRFGSLLRAAAGSTSAPAPTPAPAPAANIKKSAFDLSKPDDDLPF